MPCYDPPMSVEERLKYGFYTLNENELEAVLCSIFSRFEKAGVLSIVLRTMNWEETGVDRRMVELWWEEHKKRDDSRRKRKI